MFDHALFWPLLLKLLGIYFSTAKAGRSAG